MVTRINRYFNLEYPRRVFLISGAHGVNEFFSVAIPPILPLLVTDFGITYAKAGLLVTIYFTTYTVFQMPVGFVADRTKKSRLIIGGMLVLAVGMLLAAVADDYALLALSQGIAGIGGSAYHPAGMGLVSDIETTNTEGKAMGIHSFGGIIGRMLAPLVVGGLASVSGWRTALLGAAAIGGVSALAFAFLFRSPLQHTAASDGLTINAPSSSDPLRTRVRSTLRGAVTVPLAWWVGGLLFAKIVFGLQSGAIRTYTTAYVYAITTGSTSLANGVLFVLFTGGAVASLAFGHFADKFQRSRLLATTFLLAAVLVAATIALPPYPLVLLGWFFLLGVIVYGGLPVMNTLVSQFADHDSSGGLFGVAQTASALGGAIAPILFGAIATQYSIKLAFPTISLVGLLGGAVLLGFAVRVFT